MIVVSSTEFPGADNYFNSILVNILEHAVNIRKLYPDRKFPFLFIFYNMKWELNYSQKPIYEEFFQKTQWIMTSMPSFIKENVTEKR